MYGEKKGYDIKVFFLFLYYIMILVSVFYLQFEMLTGALPFQGQNRKETMTMILK